MNANITLYVKWNQLYGCFYVYSGSGVVVLLIYLVTVKINFVLN